jgi:hypothetical protein
MPDPVYGRFHKPGSLLQLTRGRGWNSELTGFLLPFARQDFIYIEDDFGSDTLNGVLWDLGTDAGSTAFAAGALENGTIRGATQNSSGDYILIKGSRVMFDAARNPGAEIRWKSDVVVTYKQEFGFSDALTDDTLPALNDIDTPSITNGATDGVFIGRDTAQTLTTCALYAGGTTDTFAKDAFLATQIPTADTYTRYLVQCGANKGWGIIDNEMQNRSELAVGPDTAVLMKPHFIIGTLDTVAITVDIDYIRVWAERN